MKSALRQTDWTQPQPRLTISDARVLLVGAGILAVTTGLLALFFSLLPREAVLPALASACFVLAAASALAAKLRAEDPRNRITLWDVAGALTFIGIFASALIAPEQLVQITDTGGRRD